MRLVLVLSLFIALSACALFPAPTPPTYMFRVKDEPQNHRFVFEFESQDDRALCISADAWAFVSNDGSYAGPHTLQTKSGPSTAKQIFFTDAGMVCALTKQPDCGTTRVEPGQSLRTEVPYAYFGDPESLAKDASKHFDLHKDYPFVKVCESRH
ncbi:MAG: hypothetical protein QM667_01965 [Asticcacaulis sp.]